MDPFEKTDQAVLLKQLPKDLADNLKNFFRSYQEAIENNSKVFSDYFAILNTFIDLVVDELRHPFSFEPYHQSERSPFDYYRFGLDVMRPLVLFEQSTVLHDNSLEEINAHIQNKENVILLANHQTEPDPQAIHLMLENRFPKLLENMVFIAGQRVITDPLAIPFSRGCNLLCIFSKKYIETPIEQKAEKQLHNQKTMQKMRSLLDEGGKCIYVAPSGGRDRINQEGVIEIAPFDPQSIELFYLIAQQAQKPTHFYPLALSTYDLLPPPESIEKKLGEKRHTRCTPIHLCFGQKIDMQNFPGMTNDKRLNRELRAKHIFDLVKTDYDNLVKT